MSAGARHGTILADLQVEFTRNTGLGLFHFPAWYAEQMRALRASMDWRYPICKEDQERALLDVVRAKA